MEPWFPGDGWAPPSSWNEVNELLVLLSLCMCLLLSWINCCYLSPWSLSLYPSHSLPYHSEAMEWSSGCVGLPQLMVWCQTTSTAPSQCADFKHSNCLCFVLTMKQWRNKMTSVIHCCLKEASGYLMHVTVEEGSSQVIDKLLWKSSWWYLSKL